MKRFSVILSAVGDRALAPAAPAPSQTSSFVRGVGANRTPLVFLDGKEIAATDLQSIDTKSIEKVEVLKGSKAIEMYGERAANGVIFIDSKR
jgi:TonB-dependent SusC/RagA subfamily outer membrane receptor